MEVRWWSEYQDRTRASPDVGTFALALSAWDGRGEGARLLANATSMPAIHYDKTYTTLRWNLTVTPRRVPGAVTLGLVPADARSAALAPQTLLVWWFRYAYDGVGPDGAAKFVEAPGSINVKLAVPEYNLSVSLPGVYYMGIFGTFSSGDSVNQSAVAAALPRVGFVSQRAPLVPHARTRVFQPTALIVPFSNGSVPALPKGFVGDRVVLAAIPGDARLALQPSGRVVRALILTKI